ncbi:hypothetical protein ACFU99_00610 [Streptomyces sp. NPDC057654]|uniref:hypothetical protein n=1 Tax=Streptomyces sp. NPDC057654 TaxID=3346196 RepID=UPI00368CF235
METVIKAARRLSRENGYAEFDDIKQYMLLRYCENRARFASYEPGALYAVFRKIGVEHCKNERLHYSYSTAEWIYTPKEVRNVLRHAYYREECREVMPSGKDDLIKVANDPNSIALSIWDIDEAIGSLSEEHQSAIERAYLHEETPAHGSADQRCLNRAIDRLTERLNTKSDIKQKEQHEARKYARAGSSDR